VFVIGHGAPQVTVYSQQVRALNLIWALSRKAPLEGQSIIIVGGGVAGVTAAAAAVLYGAQVTLLEHHDEFLHLQRGCNTRYLHPRIFEWPNTNARRAGAELPILNWTVGTASEVATRILADYDRIRLDLEKRTNVKVKEITNVRGVHISKDGKTIQWDGEDPCKPGAIILAVGFGIERTVAGLPRRSYWRVDPLTQTHLDSMDKEYVVLVAGTGDGGIIDALRARLKEFDHGGFLDECVLRLEQESLHKKLECTEEEMKTRIKHLRSEGKTGTVIDYDISEWLHWQYSEMSELNAIDGLLDVARPMTRVIWTGRPKYPASPFSLALNRVLGWRLWMKGQATGHVKYVQTELKSVRLLDQEGSSGYRFEVSMTSSRDELQFAHAHQVVVRYGCHPALQHSFPHIHSALGRQAAEIESDIEPPILEAYKSLYQAVRKPYAAWREDIKVRAAPESCRENVWRIRVWLESTWALSHVSWVDYEHHPEYGAVQRRAIWAKDSEESEQLFRHWINTWDDFWIRIRCSDGAEIGDWLSNAIGSTEVDFKGRKLEGFVERDQCVDALRSVVRISKGDAYHKHPWCVYTDPPSPSSGPAHEQPQK
jgi:hypothetical protein